MDTIKLQGIHGQCPAKKVKELKVGDKVKWNGGYTTTITGLLPTESGKSIKVEFKEDSNGYCFSRTMRVNRLIAIVADL